MNIWRSCNFGLGALAVAAMGLLAGCSNTMQLYDGNRLHPSEVAIIQEQAECHVVAVDKLRADVGGTFNWWLPKVTTFEILGGKHTVLVRRDVPGGAESQRRYRAAHRLAQLEHTLKLEAEAGHTYILGEDISVDTNGFHWLPWLKDAGEIAP